MINIAIWNLKRKYILSFVFVAMVPIMIIMLLLFIPVSNLFRTEVMRADGLRAKQLRDIMDARNTEIYNIAVQMSLDPRVREFLYTKAPLNHIGNYYINDVSQVIKSYGTGNSFISFIAIYFKHGSMVVTSEGKYDANYFFENVLKYDGIKSDDLKNLMSQTYYKTTMPLYKISSAASINGEYITYIQSIPIGEKNSAANIIILIEKKNMILNTGQLSLQNKEKIMIINDEGKIIFTNGQDYALKEEDINKILISNKNYFIDNSENDSDRNSIDSENSMEVSTEEGNNAIVSYAKSDVNDWTYIIISDIQNILTKVNKIRNLSIIIVLFTFAVVIFLSLVMGDLSYSPWNKLTKYISTLGNVSTNTSPYTNEYQYALGTIENLVLEKERLKHDMEKNNSYLINQMLLNICTGKNSSTELSKVALVLTYKSNIVIVADFDGDESLRSQIINVLVRWAKLHLKNCKLFSFMDDKKRICIVINSDPAYKNIMLDKINHYKNTFSKHFNITLYAGIGNSCESIDILHTSYSEAKKSLEYCYIKGNDTVVFFPEINKHIFTFLNLPVHSGNPLLNSVKIGDYDTCLKLLNEYFENVVETAGDASILYMYCLFYNFVSVILKACEEINADFVNVFNKSPEEILDIDNYRNAKQMIEAVYNMYMIICEFVQKNKISQNITLKRKVEDSIYENFTNKNFSLVELADQLGYSSSYLSRFINQEFGVGFGELLNNVRLEKARSLLQEGKYQVCEIADMVGFSSSNSFIRTFKRIEGITPTQYRNVLFSSK